MQFALSEERTLLRDAAVEALARRHTLGSVRAALDGAPAPSLWPTATSAGWPGMLSGEDAGGDALGAMEAMLVLEACGSVLADARLLGHLPATLLMECGGGDAAVRSGLASGRLRAALVDGMARGRDAATITARSDAGVVSVAGTAEPVLDAAGADVLVVCAADGDGAPVTAWLRREDAGVSVEPCAAYDATRAMGGVRLDGAAATRLTATAEDALTARHLQRAMLGAESLGAAESCLRRACDHARERVAFGRPIGSYQAIKHRLVEMLRRVENARSLTYYAGWAWQRRPAEFALAANAVAVSATDALDFAARETIFVLGGLGATWEHDASLYYRRAELSRRLAGGADAAADAVAGELLAAAP